MGGGGGGIMEHHAFTLYDQCSLPTAAAAAISLSDDVC